MGVCWVPYYQANPDGLWKYVGVGIKKNRQKRWLKQQDMVLFSGEILGISWGFFWQAKF